jgi:hypothetical protein
MDEGVAMRHAANFDIPAGVVVTGHRPPRIRDVATRLISVSTSAGPRAATEVRIEGDHFIIRAVEPEVTVNGRPLVTYVIASDEQSIVGYLFSSVTNPVRVVIDYGLGVRGEWTGHAALDQNGPELRDEPPCGPRKAPWGMKSWLIGVGLVLGGAILGALLCGCCSRRARGCC